MRPLADPALCILIGLNASALSLGDFARGYLRGQHAFAKVASLSVGSAALQILALVIGSAFSARAGR